jgi:Tol biopolymer transport system component
MRFRTLLQSCALITGTALLWALGPARMTLNAQQAGEAAAWTGLIDHVGARSDGFAPSAMVETQARGLSADGRFVVLQSAASDLVSGDTNGVDDVFVRDRATGALARASVADDGRQANRQSMLASISADGRHVAFMSIASNLTPGAETDWWFHAYVRDLDRGRTVRVSVSADGRPANGEVRDPVLSGDGRFVAFLSTASSLLPAGIQTSRMQAYVHDRDVDGNGIYDEAGATSTALVSVSPTGVPADETVDHVRISADGSRVLIETTASNLDARATNRSRHAYVVDRETRRATLVDCTPSGEAAMFGLDYRTSDLSADGRFVSFASYSPDIAGLDMNFVSQVFRFDTMTGQTMLASVSTAGALADSSTYSTSISGDGRFIASMTTASNLDAPAPVAGAIVVRDMAERKTTRIDVIPAGGALNHFYPYYVTISTDGSTVAFTSDATNVVKDGVAPNGVNAFVTTSLTATPLAATFGSAGGDGAVDVATTSVSRWTAASLNDWIELAAGSAAAVGPGTLRYTVAPNQSGAPRDGRIAVGSMFVNVHQEDDAAGPVAPAIAWNAPSDIVYGVALGGDQLNASADAPGTFTYTPAAGTVLPAGTHLLTATFTPADPQRYATASATATVVVHKARPAVDWNAPGPTVYGTPLTEAHLNAHASVPGRFSYAPGAGAVLHSGTHAIVATFTPADLENYTTSVEERFLSVMRAPAILRAEDATKTYGAPLPAFTVTAEGLVNGDTFASLRGILSFTTDATASSGPGIYAIHASGLESPDYVLSYAAGTLSVTPAPTALALSSSPAAADWNQPITLTATVGAVNPELGMPSGLVQFFDGDAPLGSAVLDAGKAVLTTNVMSHGNHVIKAAYSGDTLFDASSSTVVQEVEMPTGSTTVVLFSSGSPSHYGRSVTFAAAAWTGRGIPQGYVEFYDGSTQIGRAPLVFGLARLTISTLTEGGHAITARYTSDPTAPSAVSPVLAHHVRDNGPVNRTPRVSVAATHAAGAGVTLSAAVTATHPEAPAGRMLFLVNGLVVGEAQGTLVGSVLNFQKSVTAELAPGTYTATAVYLGSWRYRATAAATKIVVR